MVKVVAWFASMAIAIASGRPAVRIGFYTGKGTLSVHDFYMMIHTSADQSFGPWGYTVANMSSGAAVTKLSRDSFDIVVFPGGSGTGQSNELGVEGRAAVVDFVKAGGGYIGTCGGAFLGFSHLKFYGDPGPQHQGYPPACHAHGCNTSVELSAAGLESLGLEGKPEFEGNVTIMYHNGPMLKREDLPPQVSVLASFREQGAPWTGALQSEYTPYNITNTTPAITSTEYGAGRVVLNSPHPEHLPGLIISAEIYAGELSWALPRDHPVLV